MVERLSLGEVNAIHQDMSLLGHSTTSVVVTMSMGMRVFEAVDGALLDENVHATPWSFVVYVSTVFMPVVYVFVMAHDVPLVERTVVSSNRNLD
jgi:hypothetical protein